MQGAQEQQHMQQKMQPQGHPASQNWQGGMQQGYNQQQMQYMQAYNTMYMQQQMAAMHAASQMQASYAAPKPEASAPGKEAPNLLRFALLRSIARDVGDKKLANISLKEGQVALDKMQSKSAMSAMSSTPEVRIYGVSTPHSMTLVPLRLRPPSGHGGVPRSLRYCSEDACLVCSCCKVL